MKRVASPGKKAVAVKPKSVKSPPVKKGVTKKAKNGSPSCLVQLLRVVAEGIKAKPLGATRLITWTAAVWAILAVADDQIRTNIK
ncbi:hypothetical protein D5086_010034 [Populus alba]|uniref:Uncharacterized protein n=1 Tax=Populus alba TaxID=43335 RepID=A0ACC4C936_POPAL